MVRREDVADMMNKLVLIDEADLRLWSKMTEADATDASTGTWHRGGAFRKVSTGEPRQRPLSVRTVMPVARPMVEARR